MNVNLELHRALALTSAQLDLAMMNLDHRQVEQLQQRLHFLADQLGAEEKTTKVSDIKL